MPIFDDINQIAFNGNLNIAAWCPMTKVLGPGKRFAIWVQGCCFDCYNCGSPEWRPMNEAILMLPEELAKKVMDVSQLEGITISGGEPMLQPDRLLNFVDTIRNKTSLSIICFTGFRLEDLRNMRNTNIDKFLETIDVLIDGPYLDELNDNKGLRGSSNQRVHFLSGLYKDSESEFINGRRDIEIHLFKDHCLIAGIHPLGFDQKDFI